MAVPDHIVFDAEPLIAHADDEPGSDVDGSANVRYIIWIIYNFILYSYVDPNLKCLSSRLECVYSEIYIILLIIHNCICSSCLVQKCDKTRQRE